MPLRTICLLLLMTLAAAPAAFAQAAPRTPESEISGAWVVVALAGGRIAPRAPPKIVFNGRGFGGSDGCNQIGGDIKRIGRGRIAFGQTIATMMACDTPIMRMAGAFHRALKAARRYEIAGDTLRVADARGNVVMVLERTR